MAHFNEPDQNYSSNARVLNLAKKAAQLSSYVSPLETERDTLPTGIKSTPTPTPSGKVNNITPSGTSTWYKALQSLIKTIDEMEILTNTLYAIPESLGRDTEQAETYEAEQRRLLLDIARRQDILIDQNDSNKDIIRKIVDDASKDRIEDSLNQYAHIKGINRHDIPDDVRKLIERERFDQTLGELMEQINALIPAPNQSQLNNPQPAIIAHEVDYSYFKNSLAKYYAYVKKLIDSYETLLKNFEHIDGRVFGEYKADLWGLSDQVKKIYTLKEFPNSHRLRWGINSFPFARSEHENQLRANKINLTLTNIITELRKIVPYVLQLIKNVNRMRGGKIKKIGGQLGFDHSALSIMSKNHWLFNRSMPMNPDFR